MDKEFKEQIGEPYSVVEKTLYASLIRLDALCSMVSSLVEYIASKEGVSVESVKSSMVDKQSVNDVKPVTRKRKGAQGV